MALRTNLKGKTKNPYAISETYTIGDVYDRGKGIEPKSEWVLDNATYPLTIAINGVTGTRIIDSAATLTAGQYRIWLDPFWVECATADDTLGVTVTGHAQGDIWTAKEENERNQDFNTSIAKIDAVTRQTPYASLAELNAIPVENRAINLFYLVKDGEIETHYYWNGTEFKDFSAGTGSSFKILSRVPASNGTIEDWENIEITFSDNVDPATVNGTNFVLRDSGNNIVSASVAVDGTDPMKVIINPTVNLTPGTYSVNVSGNVASTGGATLGTAYNWNFTATINTAPTASNVVIPSTIVGDVIDGIDITYDYADVDGDLEGVTVKKLYLGTLADGSDKVEVVMPYTIVSGDLGKYLFGGVTPKAQTGALTGNETLSSGVVVSMATFLDPSFESGVFTADNTLGWKDIPSTGGTGGTVQIVTPTGNQTATNGTKAAKLRFTGTATTFENAGIEQVVPKARIDELSHFGFDMHIISAESSPKAEIPYNGTDVVYIRAELSAKDTATAELLDKVTKPHCHVLFIWGQATGMPTADISMTADIDFDTWISKSKDLKAYITSNLLAGKTWADVDNVKVTLRTGTVGTYNTKSISLLVDNFR